MASKPPENPQLRPVMMEELISVTAEGPLRGILHTTWGWGHAAAMVRTQKVDGLTSAAAALLEMA